MAWPKNRNKVMPQSSKYQAVPNTDETAVTPWGTFRFPRIVILLLGSFICAGIIRFFIDCLIDELCSLSTVKMMGS